MATDFLVEEGTTLESTTVGIYRTATVVKGGRRFSFAALVVVGDRNGSLGVGYGKGRGVPSAIEKAQKDARKNIFHVSLQESTIPHPVTGRFGASIVRLIPAAPGTGVIAGGTVRAVLEMAGVQDCLTKAYGSTNQKNLCKAVLQGLKQLRTKDEVVRLRNVKIDKSAVDELIETSRRSTSEQRGTTEADVVDQEAETNQPSRSSKRGGAGAGAGVITNDHPAQRQQTQKKKPSEKSSDGVKSEAEPQSEQKAEAVEEKPKDPESTESTESTESKEVNDQQSST